MYAKIDINLDISTWSETKLRAYIQVARAANFHTGQFWHSVKTLADKFGCSERWSQIILREFEDEGIILAYRRSGKTTIYLYPTALAGKPEAEQEAILEKFLQEGMISRDQGRGDLRTSPLISRDQGGMRSGDHPRGEARASPDLHSKNNGQITTTSAIKFDPYLIARLICRYGREAVEIRVVVISSLNGKIKSHSGLLIDSLERDYIPTASKEIRDKQVRREREEATEKQREEERQEWEKMQDQLERERNDPEVQARIQAEIARANAMLGITKPHIHVDANDC